MKKIIIMKEGSEHGFTLIELLVTMTIISILTAVAVPQYKSYRQRAFDARALSDIRAVALAEEAFFFDNERYLACSNNSCAQLPGIARLSLGTQLSVTVSDEDFEITASHQKGTGKSYRWSSSQGGLVE